MVVATTHHGLMKAYAQSTPGVALRLVRLRPRRPTSRPTGCTLGVAGPQPGAGDGRAAGPARRRSWRTRARGCDDKEAQAEALLKKLEEDQAALRRERGADRRAERARPRSAERAPRAARARDRRAQAHARSRRFARELRRRGEEAARKAADAIREAVAEASRPPRKAAAAAARKARTRGGRRDPRGRRRRRWRDPSVGAARGAGGARRGRWRWATRVRVRVAGRRRRGDGAARRGEAEVAVGGKRLRVPRASWWRRGRRRRPGAAGRPLRRLARSRHGAAAQRPAEINLVGLTVDEALPRVDKLLDDAALAERQRGARDPRLRPGQAAQGRRGAAGGPSRTWRRSAPAAARRRRRRDGRGAEGLDGASRTASSRRCGARRTSCATSPSTCALQEDGHVLEGPVPVPPGEDAVLQRAPRAAGLPLLRLRRGRRRLQVRDAARARRASPRRSRCVARRFGVPVPESRVRAGPRPQGARGAAGAAGGGRRSTSRATSGRRRARRAREYLLGRGFKKETLERIRAGAAPRRLGRPARRAARQASRRRCC